MQQYAYIYVFSVEDMRNAYLKDVRTHWKDSRYVALAAAAWRVGVANPPLSYFAWATSLSFFLGSNRVMAVALGKTEESELMPNLHLISEVRPHRVPSMARWP